MEAREYADIPAYLGSGADLAIRRRSQEIGSTRSVIPARNTNHVASARLSWIGTLLLFLLVCTAAVPRSLAAASPEEESTGPIAVEANPQVFATMCALVAAGFGADSTPASADLAQLRTQLTSFHGPATEALRDFARLKSLQAEQRMHRLAHDFFR